MSSVILACSEPIVSRIAGIGLRYLEFSRELSRRGVDVTLLSPAPEGLSEGLDLGGARLYEYSASRLQSLADTHDCVVAQGHLADSVCRQLPTMPKVIDLYDPYLVDHLTYAETLGEGIFRSDLNAWTLQMQHGDLFLCSGEEQRLYYAGFLTALGRVNPRLVANDPHLENLLRIVPFGVPDEFPAHRPVLPPNPDNRERYLFGCLYDWYDPWTALGALDQSKLDWELYFVLTPNSGSTPQTLVDQVSLYARDRGWLDDRVHFIDWQPPERRFDLLHDVQGIIVTHQSTLETDLSLRTRLLEALAVGCPVITNTGGTLSRQMAESGAAIVAPPGDEKFLADSLVSLQRDSARKTTMIEAAHTLVEQYRWARVIKPLLAFCQNPHVDAGKFEFYRGLVANHTVANWSLQLPAAVPGPCEKKSVHASALGFSMDDQPEVSIIIPTYNRPKLLAEILRALENQLAAPPFEVVIVDDGSDAETPALLEAWDFSMPHQLHRQENRGPAAARNRGLANARGVIVAFLGDDTVPAPDWLARHRAAHRKHNDSEDVAILGRTDWHPRIQVTPFLRFINEYGKQFGYGLIAEGEPPDYRFFYTSNLSLNRSCLAEAKFREDFPYAAWEDIELGYRLQNGGLKLIYEPAARVTHDHPTSVESFCERQQKSGVAAVVMYGLHPELGSMLQLAPDGPPALPPAHEISTRLRHAQITQYQRFYLAELWRSVLNDSYLQGLHLGWEQRQ